MVKKRGLGRGIDSIIPPQKVDKNNEKQLSTNHIDNNVDNSVDKVDKTTTNLRISLIDPNKDQPRQSFDEASLKELAESITRYGIIQPLVVTKYGKRYQIVAGERRFRAARIAGLKEVPVIIKDYTEAERAEIAIIENIQRDDLNPIEKAKAYEKLINEFGLKQEELASRLSKSRSVITNSMRLLKLTEDVQSLIVKGLLSEGHGRLLINEDPAVQNAVAVRIAKEDLGVRETERLLAEMSAKKPEATVKTKKKAERSADIERLEEELQSLVNSKVTLQCGAGGTGSINIRYYSLEEFDRLVELLKRGSNG